MSVVILILQVMALVAQVFYANVLTRNMLALHDSLARHIARLKR